MKGGNENIREELSITVVADYSENID
jgi:hypothetical protein